MYSDELMWTDVYCNILKQDISTSEASIVDARGLDPFVFKIASDEIKKSKAV